MVACSAWVLAACMAWGGGAAFEVVAEPPGEFRELVLPGIVETDRPIGYPPQVPYVPFERIVADGSPVAAGDALFALNLDVINLWVELRELTIADEEAKLEEKKAQAGQRIHDLEVQRQELSGKRDVLDARIAATRVRDEAELRVAGLELDRARAGLELARGRAERVRRLYEEGGASARELSRAMAEFEKARANLRLPETRRELMELPADTTSRYLLELEKAMLELDLGDPAQGGGLFHAIQAEWKELDLERRQVRGRMKRVYQDRIRDARILSNNVVRADLAGVAIHTGSGYEIGSRPGSASALRVTAPSNLVFRLLLSERYRDVFDRAVRAGGRLRFEVDVPALQARCVPAVLLSISMTARVLPGSVDPVYTCQVRPERLLDGLRTGMDVQCRLKVPTADARCVVPGWAVQVGARDTAWLADASPRELRGYALDGFYVVLDGLNPGDRLRAVPPAEAVAVPLRLTGRIVLPDRADLVAPENVEVSEMVADGEPVRAGDVVARVVSLWRNTTDHLAEAEKIRATAAEQKEIARIKAEAERIRAYVEWRKAELDVRRRRAEYRLARYVENTEAIVTAGVARETAAIELAAADAAEADRRSQYADGTASAQSLRAATLAVARGRVTLARAQLDEVAAIRKRDWLEVWEKQRLAQDAEDTAVAARTVYSVAREQFTISLCKAGELHQRALDEMAEHLRAEAALTVTAPRDGVVYYAEQPGGEVLETGRPLPSSVPFFMPLSAERRLELEVPDYLFGRFREGQAVNVYIPRLGAEPVQGRVRQVAPYFRAGEFARWDALVREDLAAGNRVFVVTIDLPDVADGLPPSATAWIEVDT